MSEKTLAAKILENLGGVSNIVGLENCMTRLRVSVKDAQKVNRGALEKISGVISVVGSENELQVILGPGVADGVMDELKNPQGLNYSEMKTDGALMKKKSASGEEGETPSTRQAERPEGLARERFGRHQQHPTHTRRARKATGAP